MMDNKNKFGLIATISIVIANMVGTGIFTSLGFQLFDLNQINSVIALWVLGGFIAILGSFCYAELSAAFPRSGGEYHFLRISFNNGIGFLSGWTSAIVGFAAPIAASAFAFSRYFTKVIPLEKITFLTSICSVSTISVGLSVLIVVLITIVQTGKFQVGTIFQIIFTVGKVALMVLFIIAGLYYSFHSSGSHNHSGLAYGNFWTDLNNSGFWVGLIFVSYAYSGWNASSYIIDDIKNRRCRP